MQILPLPATPASSHAISPSHGFFPFPIRENAQQFVPLFLPLGARLCFSFRLLSPSLQTSKFTLSSAAAAPSPPCAPGRQTCSQLAGGSEGRREGGLATTTKRAPPLQTTLMLVRAGGVAARNQRTQIGYQERQCRGREGLAPPPACKDFSFLAGCNFSHY